ncbi:head-tail connector protein [Algoriphagus sp. D3-2-R+10]|uniref:head-tail connector protein n=1 Tax=Algoriphagus aurantiacus TaxID=3103948 RepID=UPI002B3EC899|nr:head-tail connector protein [Algoriphagus sp. D3-2-R+10]MEB2775228.1 head-tail connector protein [Algoriphagus sp. D3-2-R+10]
MIQVIELLTEPKLVTLEEAKKHLRLNNSREDTTINSLIITASSMVEEFIDRTIFSKKLKLTSKYSPYYYLGNYIVDTVESVNLYYKNELVKEDAEFTQTTHTVNVTETIDFDYVEIIYSIKTDYPVIPESFKQAALLYIGDLFNNRQEIVIGRTAFNLNVVDRILRPYTKMISL